MIFSHKQQAGHTALILAADRGFAEVVRLLLDAKADVNHASKVRHVFTL